MQKIVIIGAGEIGLAIGRVLRPKSFNIKFWDKDARVVEALGGEQPGLPEIIPEADAVIMCVRSSAMREALLYIAPYLNKQAVVVSVSKGIEAQSLMTMNELGASLLPKKQPFVLLGGPMLAEEIREGQYGGALAAAVLPAWSRRVREMFAGTNVAVEETSDIRGVALAGVLKNVYSLVLGVASGLRLGDNAKGYLSVLALAEMKKIVSLLGGKQETVMSLAGLGDFIATGWSEFSSNHQAGSELAAGRLPNSNSEGLASLSSLVILLGSKRKNFSLLLSLEEIVQGNQEASQAFQKILFPSN